MISLIVLCRCTTAEKQIFCQFSLIECKSIFKSTNFIIEHIQHRVSDYLKIRKKDNISHRHIIEGPLIFFNSIEYNSFGILKNSVPNGKRCSDVCSALTGRHIEKRKQYGGYTELVLLLNIFWGKYTLFGIRYILD